MAKPFAAAILSLLITPALASGLSDPIVAPEVVAPDTTASSGALDSAIPALFVILVILTVAGVF